jgi:hypothetical protein
MQVLFYKIKGIHKFEILMHSILHFLQKKL